MQEKIDRIQSILKNHEIDGWLVFSHHGHDVHSKYLLEKNPAISHMILVPKEGSPKIIAAAMEAMMLNEEVYEIEAYKSGEEFKSLVSQTMKSFIPGSKLAMNFVEKEEVMKNISLDIIGNGMFEYLRGFNEEIEYISAKEIIYDIRSVKTKTEIENHKIAAQLAEELMEEAIEDKIKSGLTEKELAAMIEYECNKRGGVAFDAIVATGPHSAIPHHHPSDKKLENNQVLLIDYGVTHKFANSDITHTYWIGSNPPEKVLRVYEAVHEAKEAAYKVMKAGAICSLADAAVREKFAEFGYDPDIYYLHSTGHSLGIETHDIGVGIYRELEDRPGKPLLENSIITVEPGLYFMNEFGVRLEDDAVVTKDGTIRLSNTPKEMKML